jgi:hypothetical protein
MVMIKLYVGLEYAQLNHFSKEGTALKFTISFDLE